MNWLRRLRSWRAAVRLRTDEVAGHLYPQGSAPGDWEWTLLDEGGLYATWSAMLKPEWSCVVPGCQHNGERHRTVQLGQNTYVVVCDAWGCHTERKARGEQSMGRG